MIANTLFSLEQFNLGSGDFISRIWNIFLKACLHLYLPGARRTCTVAEGHVPQPRYSVPRPRYISEFQKSSNCWTLVPWPRDMYHDRGRYISVFQRIYNLIQRKTNSGNGNNYFLGIQMLQPTKKYNCINHIFTVTKAQCRHRPPFGLFQNSIILDGN